MHYLQDWGPSLKEFRRVIVPGGRLVISTHHPFMDHPLAGGPDYFATYAVTEEWTRGGQTVLMRFWHRPLHAMTDAFRAAGYTLGVIAEPQPDPPPRACSRLPTPTFAPTPDSCSSGSPLCSHAEHRSSAGTGVSVPSATAMTASSTSTSLCGRAGPASRRRRCTPGSLSWPRSTRTPNRQRARRHPREPERGLVVRQRRGAVPRAWSMRFTAPDGARPAGWRPSGTAPETHYSERIAATPPRPPHPNTRPNDS